jgi:hypothetical protein
MNRLIINGNSGPVCPYLGSKEDQETAFCYASSLNFCYRAKPATPIKSAYQGTCCLTATHSECRVYQKEPGLPLPVDLRYRQQRDAKGKQSRVYMWMILCAIVIIGLLIGQSLSGGLFRFTGWQNPLWEAGPIALTKMRNTALPALPILPTLIHATLSSTLLPFSPSPAQTIVKSTPTLISFHTLETPIGLDHRFIIHRILDGESLDFLSDHYGTTVEAIMAINHYIQVPLLTNFLIIIPFQRADVANLPTFQAFQVQADSSVEILAGQLGTDPALLVKYNDLREDEILKKGDWVLVPHSRTATP